MNKRIQKKTILESISEATLSMDMETYKKEKNSLDKDDKVVIKDEDKSLYEVEETVDNFVENEDKLFETFIRIVKK